MSAKIQDRLLLKLHCLRGWLESEVPSKYKGSMRFSLRWFAHWEDAALGIERVTRPGAISKNGPYGQLAREAERILTLLQKKTSRGYEPRGQQIKSLKSANAELQRLNEKLASQWHAERAEVESLRKELSFEKATLQGAEKEIGELKAKLVKMVPLHAISPSCPSSTA